MNNKSFFLWVAAFVLTIALAYYQRVTGPTYPISGEISINGKLLEYKLPRSNESHIPALIEIKGNFTGINARAEFKRLKVQEDWQYVDFVIMNEKLVAKLPQQPPAGKLEYKVFLQDKEKEYPLVSEPVIIRFKGAVPLYALIPHIIVMFSSMLFSTRAGIEALVKGTKTTSLTLVTIILLALGGLILGPIVQKFAFDSYWTGWPFGNDLTDNKTLIAFIAWLAAWFKIKKNPSARAWVIAAAVILVVVFLIPHSVLGSELDYSTGKVETGR